MTVGLVIVSHSAALASGVRELAAQMAPGVTIAVAGGTDEGGIGTSFERVTTALAEADSGDGVVVLYDLGSALLTTETAVEFSDPDAAERITVVDAPLVEGAVAAAVAAQSGTDLASVATAAQRAGASWDDAHGSGATAVSDASVSDASVSDASVPDVAVADTAVAGAGGAAVRRTATVADADGLHARPASLLAREVGRWSGTTVTLGRAGEPAVPVTDVLQLIGLGVRQGETVEIAASGEDAEAATTTLAGMIDAGLDR